MFRLTSTNLPIAPKGFKLAPAFTIWGQTQGMGAVLKINTFAQWLNNPGWEIDTLPLGDPISVGKYSYLVFPHELVDVQINPYQVKEDSIEAIANNFWFSGQTIHFYEVDLIPTEAKITFAIATPIPENNIYTIELPDGFVASKVSYDGLAFSLGMGAGTFSQSGSTLSITGSASYALPVGELIYITGDFTFVPPTPELAIATFYLPQILYLDRFDWVGKSFSPTEDAIAPQAFEFTWSEEIQVANAFLPFNSMPGVAIADVQSIFQDSNTVNFDR